MKKIFTLIAVALVAISASAQDAKDEITNGKIAYKPAIKSGDFSKYPATQLVNFVVNEWVNGEKVSVGTARVTVDPVDADAWEADEEGRNMLNYCLEVCSRDPEVDPETGEAKNLDAWDSQFFITVGDKYLNEGDKVKLKMDVKAEKAAKASTQAHANAGNYNHYAMVGDINFTTEWAPFESDEITISAQQAYGQNGDKPGFATIALNLAELKEANKYYFDNIELIVTRFTPKEYNWYTIFENDGTDASSFSVKYFKNYTDAAKSKDGAIVVTSLEPDKTYAEYYMENGDGNAVDAVLANDWDTQFLINLPVTLTKGQKFNLSFKYWADKDANTNTQAHLVAPVPGTVESKGLGQYPEYGGTYLHYQLAGDVAFTTTESTFEKVITVPDAADGMGAICFNLNVLKESINYYFDDIVVQIEEESVPTGISTFKAEKATKAIYNVAGQQIKDLQKGLNIVDGKKVYVK
ncbi:MAG: hypothetical protein K6E52_10385 [Bacteroidaceae bacterium]|nr:hypothetical protein [Bacteroidaceae bacterium]